jgi:NAD(P)-dependent dehydrogenase (short-subunit alcohol dehydrogenase family)
MSEKPIALITGGNRGIGLAIARSLAQDGFHVVIGSRSGQVVDGFDSVAIDVSTTQSVEDAFSHIENTWGIPEVLVCNAGITKDALVMRMSDEDFEDVVNTNLTGAFRVAKRATKGLLKLKKGRLIFISSVVAMLGSPGQVNYAASKSGLIGMARSFARELGSRGITANVIAPGFVETDMTASLDDKRRQEIASSIPLGRFSDTEEIANVVSFIASTKAGYITGALIPVDGGLGMGH